MLARHPMSVPFHPASRYGFPSISLYHMRYDPVKASCPQYPQIPSGLAFPFWLMHFLLLSTLGEKTTPSTKPNSHDFFFLTKHGYIPSVFILKDRKKSLLFVSLFISFSFILKERKVSNVVLYFSK